MRALALLALAVLVPLGCGSGDTSASPAPGEAISIERALAAGAGEEVRVSGNLLAVDGDVRFCSALAESFPPQCGRPSLRVEGLELDEVSGLVTSGGVSWTDRPIELAGTVGDGVLAVGQNAMP